MTYRLSNPDGILVLSTHTPQTWAQRVQEQLRALGCSQKYAARVASRISAATREEETLDVQSDPIHR